MPRSEQSGADQIAVGRLVTDRIRLTNAEIKALRATPKELVRGRAGQVIQFVSAVLELNYGGTNAFSESSDNFAVRYTDGSGAIVSDAIEATGFIDQTANTITNARAKADAIVASASAEGKSLVLHNTGDGEIGGNAGEDNTVTVSVSYIVHELN